MSLRCRLGYHDLTPVTLVLKNEPRPRARCPRCGEVVVGMVPWRQFMDAVKDAKR